MRHALFLVLPIVLTACSGAQVPDDATSGRQLDQPEAANPAGTRPSGAPQLITVEGRIEEGVECPILRTPDGEVWSLSLGEADFGPGDYVRFTGEQADASFCQQGSGTLIPETIEEIDPPPRDRDPARAGGLAVTGDYVRGSWVAKGLDADCDRPDFQITQNRNGGSIIETSVNGVPATGMVDVGNTPALQWNEGIPTLPIETRGPDGLAILPSPDGRTVTLAGKSIEGDGVVFVKCA